MIQKEMDSMQQEITLMARQAESIFQMALHVLKTRDERAAREVIETDRVLDQLEIALDKKSIRLLALSDPYALDLRYVFSAIKTATHLERVGDESKSVARWTGRLKGMASQDLITLGEKTRQSLELAVRCLIHMDPDQGSEEVFRLEDEIDALEDKIIQASTSIPEAFIARSLERVADMATNLVENVIFSARAKDIRHGAQAAGGKGG